MKQERQETRKLQFLHKGMATLLLLLLSTIGAWADSVDITQNSASDKTWTSGKFTVDMTSGTGQDDGVVKLGNGGTCVISTSGSETITGATITYGKGGSDSYTERTAVISTSAIVSDTGSRFSFGSFTSNVLTVSVDGNTYVKQVTVTYSSGGGKTTTTLSLTPNSGTIYADGSIDIHSNVLTNSNATVTYTSNNTSVATVTSAGVISGVAAGSTTITVAQDENASYTAAEATYTITVNAVPTQYTVSYSVNPAGAGTITTHTYGTGGDAYNNKSAGDNLTSGASVSNGTNINLTATAATGYNWSAWSNGSTKPTPLSDYSITSNKLFIANFTAKTYTITLDKGTGGATDGEATATYNSSTLTSVTDATHATLTLKGYYTAASAGTKIINANGSLVASTSYTDGSGNWTYDGDVTLYAQWEAAATYTVTYNANLAGASGSVTDGNTYEAGASVTTQANSFSKSGYTFLGWSTSDGYQSSYTIAGNTVTMVAGGLDLYAQWQIDGSISSSPASGSSVVSGQAVTTTATSTAATGIKYNQGASEYTVAQLIASGGSVGSKTLNWTLSQNAIGAHIFSAVLTDGTFYSAVLTQNYTIGAAAPVISCASNTVTITSATDGASIYYTTNGDTPTSGSTLYSAPFPIGENTTVKAIAIKSGSTSATTTQVCEYGAAVTALPVTFDFTNTTYWPTSTDFSGANNANLSIIDSSNNHEIVFRGTSATEFDIDGSGLEIGQNGATNHFIAIPISGINGRIDIDVWAPYSSSTSFKIRGKLDTANTTAQTSAGSLNTLNVNKYEEGHFNFRIKDISATEGVLYIGRNGSSYPCIEKIRITTAAANLVPDKASVFMGDAEKDTTVVTITNNTPYNVLVKTVPSYVNATYEPSTGKLTITPKAVGSGGNIELCVDTNGDGVAGDTDLSIPVTVTGITNVTAPTSAVYDTSSGSYSPALDALSVTATKSATGNTGTLAYQWYSNTVNSNTGGTVISGATSNTLSTDKISTTDSEKAAFYYCVVSLPGDSCKSVASDVAYVLTSSSKRYFQMSNVAGNRQTSDASEKITGEIVAGGTATAIHGADSYYRYITRPSSSYAHMYVVKNANNYIKINLDKAIATDDVISVLQMGNQGTSAGIKIATDASGSNAINIYQDGTDTKTYSATFTDAFNGVKEIYILGKYAGHQNYFTDLYISKPAPLAVSAPTPASQRVQSGETPAAFTVTATGGTGSYTYAWKQDTDPSGSFNDDAEGTVVSDGGTSTFTPTSKSVTSNTNYYYKCIVTSGASYVTTSAATLTVTTLTHGYMTIDGTEHDDMTFSFANNVCTYMLQEPYYNEQKDGTSQYTKFWTNNGTSWSSGTVPSISSSSETYLKMDSNGDYMTFYVKGATAFTVAAGNNNTARKYSITVDDVLQGEYSIGSESPRVSLRSSGSKIVITSTTGDTKYFGRLTFYEKQPATIEVMKSGEAVTEDELYLDGGNADYEVASNSAGAITASSGNTSVATVSYSDGTLTVTPVAAGTATITINQAADGDYSATSTTLTVTVKKHTLKLAFSYEKATFNASTLTENNQWNTGSLPVLTITRDGEPASLSSYTIHYETDEKNVGYFGASQSTSSLRSTYEELSGGSSYRIRWGGSQGGARIYAYVTNPSASETSEVVYFDLVVEAGTSNNLPKGTHPTEQDQFELQNSEGVTVVTLTYGGYKYKKENGWSAASAKGKYYIDGYANYTRHDLDSYDEYGYQLRGMNDEATGPTTSKDAKAKYSFNTWSSQNVGSHKFWYEEGTAKPGGGTYGKYERIRPFTLPCRGGYLKFEPKQTGKLTVYVWQNGVIGRGSKANQIGSKPRLGYWFDAEGWVQTPSVDPVSKQPISNGNGRDTHEHTCNAEAEGTKPAEDGVTRNLDAQMDYYWTDTYGQGDAGDADIIPALRYQYCDNAENPTNYYADSGEGHTDINPYYWMLDSEVSANNALMIPKKMKPLMYHNGYFVPEDSYVKYVLNVVAGKTYYFQGMMTKIGYVGMNFVKDESVFGASFGHNESLHLNAADNMATVVSSQTKDITVYDEVTLPSNYKKGQWSTICLPFALSENQVEEAFGKGTQLTLYNGAIKKSEGIYTVKYLSHVDRNILPGQAYFIRPTGVDANGDDLATVSGKIGSEVEGQSGTRITFNTVCIDKTNFSTETSYGNNTDVDQSGSSIGQEGYVFVGAYNNETLPKYSYIVSGGLLRQFTGTTTKIPTYYAYLKPNTSAASSGSYSLGVEFADEAMENTWGGDQEATGLEIMKEVADAMNRDEVFTGKAYNMMGQEIDPRSAKGMVIINGKKIMK